LPTRAFSPAAVQRWNVVQATVWPAALLALLLATGGPTQHLPIWLAIGAMAVASYVWLLQALGGAKTLADRVTIGRFLAMVATCALAVANGAVGWPLWLALVAVVLADLADGWAARRFGSSEAGAVLDMETDQLATLGLALVACGVADVPAWVLALPALRWLTVLLRALLGAAAGDPKPRAGDNRQGRALCALMLVLLLASLLPAAGHGLRTAAAALAVLVLAWSHGSDLVYLLRRPRARAENL
jgi:phosphatidylglycerophosphate synthase